MPRPSSSLVPPTDIAHTVEQRFRKLIVQRGTKKTTRLFGDLATTQAAFTQTVQTFKDKGYLQAGEV